MKARGKKSTHVASPANLLTGWARQGVQSFVAAQKILMELAAQENALLIGMLREEFAKSNFRPGASMVGFAEAGVKNLSNVGKILLDFAADETALVVDGVKEGLRVPAAAGAVADVARHRMDTLIGMQKHILDAAAEQTHAMADSYRKGKGLMAGTKVGELARRGIEGLVEGEKKFLDMAAREFTTATRGGKQAGKRRERMEVFTDLARQGAEKYIDTQKKLLELAIDQLETAGKSRVDRKIAIRKSTPEPWKELTEKSVKNIVAAEKSLLDLATKPKKGIAREEIRKAGHRPRSRTVHARGHKTAEGTAVAAV